MPGLVLGAAPTADLLNSLAGNLLASGVETVSRVSATTSATWASQSFRTTHFTARRSLTSTQVKVLTGGTAAGATPTLCRIGLYLLNAAGDGSLVASTANDTTLFAAANTAYTRSWSAPYDVVAGQRYALAAHIVSAAAMPSFAAAVASANTAMILEMAMGPRLSGSIAAQANLPASFLESGLSGSGGMVYGVILP